MNWNPTKITVSSIQKTLLKTSAVLAGAIVAFIAAPGSASAQCIGGTTCTPISLSNVPVAAMVMDIGNPGEQAYNNRGRYTATLYSSATKPLPAALPGGNYPAWCGTTDIEGLNAGGYVVRRSYLAAATLTKNGRRPDGLMGVGYSKFFKPGTWKQGNWVVNH